MVNVITSQSLPEKALLRRYKDGQAGSGHAFPAGHAVNTSHAGETGYTDCFTLELKQRIKLADFIEAFYTSPLFKVERFILRLIGKSANNQKARELALGQRTDFAAWTVEDRTPNQILLCDFVKKTRSWLMVEYLEEERQSKLYFGSAVVFIASESKKPKPPLGFSILSRFHVWYSKALLKAAYRRLLELKKS